MKPEFRFEYDDQYDKIDIYVDDKLSAEWAVYTTPEDSFEEFKRVFKLGVGWALKHS